LGRGMGMFATRRIPAGQVMWTEHPLITYKKRAADEDLETYVDSLHQAFCQLNETEQAKLLNMYGPEEEVGRQGVKWKLFRICAANEVGGQNKENSVYELYCRLNHACCNNAVGQTVMLEDGPAYQVRAVKNMEKGEEMTQSYLTGKLCTREERQAIFRSKWGFTCDCRLCNLPLNKSLENDATLHLIKDLQWKIIRIRASHTESLQELHQLLAACYKVADQDQALLKYVLLAIQHGQRKVGANLSEFCPEGVKTYLEARLGKRFWTSPDSYQRELMRMARIFGYQESITKIIQMPWSDSFYSELLKMVCCTNKYFFAG